ncbi:MAG: hypothetical protein NT006_01835 [Candidatus Aminicenantes bacterium]|nr:hypothetical protein [Candidatus Aminicenantes bacterium]
MKKPYIKKVDQIGPLTVWIVDGQYVRKNIDEEFTNFGQHFRFRFIPLHEFWIDQEHGPGELQFFIDHLLVERRLMTGGMTYDKALEKADAVEKKERRKTELIREISRLPRVGVVENIHKRLGGHDQVYHFVPKNEVWLDDDLGPGELRFVLLHELHERHLMTLGWPYVKAHRSASRIEYHCRAHPEDLEADLGLEVERNR